MSTVITDGSVCDFHWHTQNWVYASVWECTSSRGRNPPTCTPWSRVIRGVALRQWWKGDENSPEMSTVITGGSVCDFHWHTQNWVYASVWECTSSRGRNLPTCTPRSHVIRGAPDRALALPHSDIKFDYKIKRYPSPIDTSERKLSTSTLSMSDQSICAPLGAPLSGNPQCSLLFDLCEYTILSRSALCGGIGGEDLSEQSQLLVHENGVKEA
jgi:hypothetical protein